MITVTKLLTLNNERKTSSNIKILVSPAINKTENLK